MVRVIVEKSKIQKIITTKRWIQEKQYKKIDTQKYRF